MHKTPYLLACAILPCSLLRRDKLLNSHQNTLASVTLLYTSFFLRLKKIRFFQKIGFLSWCRSQKNPIFSKNRIFKLVSLSKKIRFFEKIGFLSWCRSQKNPIFCSRSHAPRGNACPDAPRPAIVFQKIGILDLIWFP
jgi:hypothetical protein